MSFVVEDGTGKSDANSFISLAEANAYHADRRNAVAWALLTDAQKQYLLIEATSFINGMEWATGVKANDDQALEWPRSEAEDRNGFGFDSDEIPEVLKHAVADLAFRIKDAEALADIDKVKESVTVGPISVKYSMAHPITKQYPFIELLLVGLIYTSSSSEIERG